MSNTASDLVLPHTVEHGTAAEGRDASAPATDGVCAQRTGQSRPDGDALWEAIGSLTVIVPLKRAATHHAQLTKALDEIDEAIRAQKSPLASVKGLHVARWVVLPDRVRGRGAKMQRSLVMWTIFDGTRDEHLRRLVEHARPILDEIYRHCQGYPEDVPAAKDIIHFLAAHEAQGRVAAFTGTPGISVDTVCRQQLLVTALVDHLRQFRQLRNTGTSPEAGLSNQHLFLEAKKYICNGIGTDHPELREFARRRPVMPVVRNLYLDIVWDLLRSRIAMSVLGVVTALAIGLGVWWRIPLEVGAVLSYLALCGAAGLGIVALLVIAWGFALRFAEKREARQWIPAPMREFRAHDEALKTLDNEGPGMNRVTIITDLKPGLVRQVTLRFVLWLVAFRAGRNFEGALQGVETIHFAQWRIIDGGRRLMFMSNYDGRALDYFADFAESSAPGVNAIWGNTEGMPSTTALIGDGSRDLEAFENAARVHQIPTDAWYCGYKTRRFVTRRINENWRIHRLLHEFPTPSQVDDWVDLLRESGL